MRADPKTGRLEGVQWMPAADHGGSLLLPRFVVVHYTAGGSLAGAARTLTAKDDAYLSAHVIIDRDGSTVQCVRLDTVAYHAGESLWRGYRRLNSCSIGIELVNPGYSRAGISAPMWPTIRAVHKAGGPAREWFAYAPEQIAALNEVLAALYSAYGSIRECIGHDDIAPGRKTDPGPAFPWAKVLQPGRV